MGEQIRILIADPIAEEGLARLRAEPGAEIEVALCPGLKGRELAEAMARADGMIIRSGARVTAETLAHPGRLRAIVRAGVGVDNVDLAAATEKGVLVMNTPDGNTITTAEHTLAMMLALARHIPEADALMRAGRFKEGRARLIGAQLSGKTLGVVGLGRVGKAVAQRALGLEMTVLGYDPFYAGEAVLDGRVPLLGSLDEMLPQVDFLTVHTPLSEQTRHLISARELRRMKRSARVVNVARGGIYNEADLAAALDAGLIAGAAVDVLEEEPPPPGHPLLSAKNVVLTPHLGASTSEAQSAVAVEAVDLLLGFLLRDQIRNAVNADGLKGSLSAHDRCYLDLARRMARVAGPLLGGRLRSVRLNGLGDALAPLSGMLARAALCELLSPGLDGPPNLINVAFLARGRGIQLLSGAAESGDQGGERIELTIEDEGSSVECTGAVYHGVDNRPRLLSICGYRMDMVPEGPLLVLMNHDEPGVVGVVGTLLGKGAVNIAGMTVARKGDQAMMVLKLDAPAADKVLSELRTLPPVRQVHQVILPEVAR